jgi:glucans biosynthesis protein C
VTVPAHGGTARLAWIDWLKVLVVLGVFAYHAAQPFVLTEWFVTSDDKSLLLSAMAGLGYLFGMPLMFVLAGAASWTALQRTTTGAYLGKRLRLVVPLVVGIAVLGPLQAWIGALTAGDPGPLPAYALTYWQRAEPPTGPVWLGTYGSHLWFIGFLVIYAVVSVPILRRLVPTRRARAGGPALAIGSLLVLVLSQLALRVAFPAYRDWADFAAWLGYFLLGAAMLAWPPLLAVVATRGLRMVAPAIFAAAAVGAALALGPGFELEAAPRYDALGIGYIAVRTVAGWCWVLVGLGIGARWLDRAPAAARAAGELVLPFYVLHHPITVVVAAVVLTSAVPAGLQFPAIVALALPITVAASLTVARTTPLRPWLGMGPRPRVPLGPLPS